MFEVKGPAGPVVGLVELDIDGPGPEPRTLFVSGDMMGVGPFAFGPRVAQWNGEEFTNLPPLTRAVGDVAVFDFDGAGARMPEIVAAGGGPWVLRAGAWEDLSGALPLPPPSAYFRGVSIGALAVLDEDGAGALPPMLYVAGGSRYQEKSGLYCGGSQVYIARHRNGVWEPVVTWAGTPFTQYFVRKLQPVRLSAASDDQSLALWTRHNLTPCYGLGTLWGEEHIASILAAAPQELVGCSYWETDPGPCFGYQGLAVYDGLPYGAAEPTLYANSEVASGPARPLATPPIWISQLHTADLDANGPGPELMYASGPAPVHTWNPPMQVHAWDGAAWSSLGAGISGGEADIHALAAFPDGASGVGGSSLYVAGEFTKAGSSPAKNIARWTGTGWAPLGNGMNNEVHALARFDDGAGYRMYAGGAFGVAGGAPAIGIAAWEGNAWQGVGGGTNHHVDALGAWDDGAGMDLYAGGKFTRAGGSNAYYIARWNGQQWSALGAGTNDNVNALVAYDDGSGSALYAAGKFTAPGNRVAKWSGSAWSALGSGANNEALAAASYGGSLYLGGKFTSVGGVAASRIARWNGSAWSAVAAGTNNDVQAMAVFNQPGGAVLYVGGKFTTAGGLPAPAIAKWNGTGWGTLGQVISGEVKSIGVGAVDQTPRLYIGGEFSIASTIGGVQARNLAAWDGAHWYAAYRTDAPVLALRSNGGPLFVGGSFTELDGQSSLRVAQLECGPPAPCYADCNGDGTLNLADFGCYQTQFALGDMYADCNGDGALNLADFGCFQTRFAQGCP